MAELLSVQVHVPVMKGNDGAFSDTQNVLDAALKLKKVENTNLDSTNLNVLPKRKAVDIRFQDLTYSVSEGRKKGKYNVYDSRF